MHESQKGHKSENTSSMNNTQVSILFPYIKFQDPISDERTNDPKAICSSNFFEVGDIIHVNDMNSLIPKDMGPVVQSIVSLTSSLRVISLTVLADSIYNILIFFAEKMWVAFALQKLLTFFQQKISAYLRITRCKF